MRLNSKTTISTKPLNSSKEQHSNKGIRYILSHMHRLRALMRHKDFATLVATFTILAFGIYIFSVFSTDYSFYQKHYLNSGWLTIISIFGVSLLSVKLLYFLYMGYNFLNYKSIASVEDQQLPKCTVIVPAYNEGKQVYDTLVSIVNSNYPKNKIEIISIDDGSTDDTWQWIKRAQEDLGLAISIHQQVKNMGKRHGLYHGFKNGSGDVFVTIDSDSIIEEDTLRNLVSPFAHDPNCGAVAGNIKVLNTKKGVLPKMLDVSFVLSFEFARSAESHLKSVMCTPGALAAYKSISVYACLEDWMHQTFMGEPSDIGEDRALTNMILKQGQHVLFQKNAVAYTNVPETYQGLYKMFIRWGRSNVRENLEMAKYVFSDFRPHGKTGPRLLLLSQLLHMVFSYPLVILMLFFVLTHPLLFLSGSLLSILVISSFSVLFYAHRYKVSEGIWAYTYSLLYTFGLFWITPYAIATASRRGWVTRGLS
ncbi:glycosyltransferase [Winogradskyella aurantia]|uniref:Glycosyl transferase family 2 n=1 Tax=Winogradskyella aurantia TaxID=1915063 RepID=A0A265UW14_9FLAO|nr:glycosyltransferase [Winogradskyella aurantia]OZV69392.1 glycosyl transferase family 2 [Winogradskyella aurantia]